MRRTHPLALALSLALGLAALLAGCAPSADHRASTLPPAPTATPQVLYQADWTRDAGQWALPAGWRITADGLANSGHSATRVIIPYSPTVKNYTIELTLKVNAVVGASACGNAFGLEGQTAAGAAVYDATVSCIDRQYHGFSYIYCSNADGGMSTYDYATGVSPRVYDINVADQYVSYTLSGAFLGTSHCDLPTAPAKLVLLNTGMDTVIRRITITTP
jgi:hypothetical protein